MEAILVQNSKLIVESCITCGVTFALPEVLREECKRKGADKSFYCPNGHEMVFRKSKADLLTEQLDKANRQKEEAERERWALHNELLEKKTEVIKLQATIKRRNKRIAAGICPCCNRTFKQLAEHMKNKHPEQVQKFPEFAIHKRINTKA